MRKTILYIAFILCTPLLVHAADADTTIYQRNPNYQLQMEMQKVYRTKNAEIVMLGNSLTHGANWNELLGRENVVERGIPGDILEGYVNRLNNIYKLNPRVCFVLGGINDIYNWIPVETIFQNYLLVINGLKSRNIEVVIQSTTYAAEHWGKEWLSQNNPELDVKEYNAGRNREADKLNALLKTYALKNGITYVDINSKLSRGSFLKKEVTHDGIHLNAKGYKIWGTEVNKALEKLGI